MNQGLCQTKHESNSGWCYGTITIANGGTAPIYTLQNLKNGGAYTLALKSTANSGVATFTIRIYREIHGNSKYDLWQKPSLHLPCDGNCGIFNNGHRKLRAVLFTYWCSRMFIKKSFARRQIKNPAQCAGLFYSCPRLDSNQHAVSSATTSR